MKMSDSAEVVDIFGPDPLEFCLFTSSGRMMVIITPFGNQDAAWSPGGYSGRYSVEDSVLVTQVDVATHESQAGTQQRGAFFLRNDLLTLVTPELPFGQADGRKGVSTAVWRREQQNVEPARR